MLNRALKLQNAVWTSSQTLLNCWLGLAKLDVWNGWMSYIMPGGLGRYLLLHFGAWRDEVTLEIRAISSLIKEEIIFGLSSATCVCVLFWGCSLCRRCCRMLLLNTTDVMCNSTNTLFYLFLTFAFISQYKTWRNLLGHWVHCHIKENPFHFCLRNGEFLYPGIFLQPYFSDG